MSDANHRIEAADAGEYIVVARRYRPQTFADLIGQQHIAGALAAAITTNRVGHAYLFTGARGVGKTSAARIFAKALDCREGPAAEPCNECEICRGVSSGDDVDVLEIDGASNRGIDEIRQLRSNVNIRPSRARFKIYIIDEVHMLTREAFNALLKTLEEPPEHVKFIFCTTEPTKIPITVLSRCQRFDFAGIESASIVARLRQIADAEGVVADDEALELLARRAAGSMRDSQSLLEQLLAFAGENITAEVVHRMLGTADSARLVAMAQRLAAGDAAGALADLDQALSEGVDVGQLMNQLLGVFRDCMVAQAGCSTDAFLHTISGDETAAIQTVADQLGLETILAILQILEQALSGLRYTTHQRTLAEIALVRACKLEGLEELSNLIAELRDAPNTQRPESDTASGRVPSPKKKSEGTQKAPLSRAPVAADRQRAPIPSSTSRRSVEAAVADARDADARDEVPSGPTLVAPLTEATAKQIWEQALSKLSGVVTAKARQYNRLAAPGSDQLVVTFDQTYNMCKSYCERPEQAKKIARALEEVTGSAVRVTFTLCEDEAVPVTEKPARPVSRQQKMAAAADNPLVRRARELFGARPIDVDDG